MFEASSPFTSEMAETLAQIGKGVRAFLPLDFRKGYLTHTRRIAGSYGTILVNLETGHPLDLLPDRTVDAVLPWLESHQEIEVVSQDCASAYADAVKRALPHATQVADRYHLIQNLREHLQRLLDRKRTCLPEIEDILLKAVPTNDPGDGDSPDDQTSAVTSSTTVSSSPEESTDRPLDTVQPEPPPTRLGQEVDLSSLTYAERRKKISRDKRYARYEHVLALHQAGMGQRAIARELQMSRRIVQRFLTVEAFPERASGSGLCPKSKKKRRLSSRGASFLLILSSSKLNEVQQQQVEQMKHNEDLHTVYRLSQEFVTMLKERQVEALTPGSSELKRVR